MDIKITWLHIVLQNNWKVFDDISTLPLIFLGISLALFSLSWVTWQTLPVKNGSSVYWNKGMWKILYQRLLQSL